MIGAAIDTRYVPACFAKYQCARRMIPGPEPTIEREVLITFRELNEIETGTAVVSKLRERLAARSDMLDRNIFAHTFEVQ